MNIFILHDNPEIAAQFHCNKHVVKMILESCQILCTVHHMKEIHCDIPYRPTHTKHICVLWAGETEENFNWLLQLTKYLLMEYTYRYEKTHKCKEVYEWLILHPLSFSEKKLTNFVQAMPQEYKMNNSIDAYRNYYNLGKKHILQYKRRHVPLWLEFSSED
jgi:hypothetical protein